MASGNPFAVRVDQLGQIPVLTVNGEVNYESIEAFRQALSQVRLQAPSKAVIELNRVTMLASVGLGELSKFIKWGMESGCDVRLVSALPHVRDVLEISGIHNLVSIHETVETALKP